MEGNELVRMQVLLGREEREALEDEARRRGVSMSEVVRQAVRMLREESAPYDSHSIEDDPLWGLIGSVRFGDPKIVETIDDELYGPSRP